MRRRNMLGLAVVLLAPSSAVVAQIALAERRAIAAYRQEKWPPIEAAIPKVAGFDVPIDVEWDQLTIPGDAAYYANDEYYGKRSSNLWSPR